MPYDRLPARLRQLIPSEHGQSIFRGAFNAQLKAGRSKSVAFASAWGALDRAGYKKGADGKYEKVTEKASGAKPLYMKRKVLNAEKIIEWAKSQGLATTLHPDDMHVTVIYSKEPFSAEYTQMAEAQDEFPMYYGNHVVRGGKRSVERLGQNGEALVLKIECPKLASEHYGFRAMGASSDWPDYKPHITLSWKAEGVKESDIKPFDGDIVLSDIFVSLLDEDWKSGVVEKSNPSADVEKADTFKPPAGARAAARRAIRWKEKYGDKVKGGTQVGWTCAGQLARGESLSRETVARMASFFARHKGNETVDPNFKGEPWRDNGHVMHLAWGGDAAASWSRNVMDRLEKRQIDDDQFTTQSEAMVRSLDLGLKGETHVHERVGQAVYMPGENHEEYIERIREIAGIESDEEPVNEGLLERAISAIIGAIMPQVDVNKSQEEATVLKVDNEQGLVYGWAYVSTEDGKLLVDTQGDSIEPIEMEKMATNFMLNSRNAKVMHKGENVGTFVHSFPLTNDIMKAFDIYSDREGWLVAMKPASPDVMAAYKAGDYTGFSIGGKAGDVEEYDAS